VATESIVVRVKPELKRSIEREARSNERSVSQELRKIITLYYGATVEAHAGAAAGHA
jgi:hypothetical protein